MHEDSYALQATLHMTVSHVVQFAFVVVHTEAHFQLICNGIDIDSLISQNSSLSDQNPFLHLDALLR